MFRICTTLLVALVCSCSLFAQPPLPNLPPLPAKPPLLYDSKDAKDGQSPKSPPEAIRTLLTESGANPPTPQEFLNAVKQQLGSGDMKQRLEALLAIDSQGEADESILPKLDGILKSSNDPFERILAAGVALRSDTPNQAEAIKSLADGLRSEDAEVAIQAALAHGKGGQKSEETLLAALDDANPTTRCLAAESLGKIGLDAGAEKLAVLLKDQDATVRAAAAKSLRGNDQFTDALLSAINSDSQLSVRANAAASLTGVGARDEKVQAALIGAMLGENQANALATIRAIANSDAPLEARAGLLGLALTKAKSAYAAEIIGHLVEMEEPGMKALVRGLDFETSRYWSAVALSAFGSKASSAGGRMAALLDKSTPDVNTEILLTLGNIDPDRTAVSPAVTKEMTAKENGVRYAATLTAIRLGLHDQAVQRQLSKNRSSDDKVLALISAFALAKLNPTEPKFGLEAFKALTRAVASGDPRLKPLAELALLDLKANLP